MVFEGVLLKNDTFFYLFHKMKERIDGGQNTRKKEHF